MSDEPKINTKYCLDNLAEIDAKSIVDVPAEIRPLLDEEALPRVWDDISTDSDGTVTDLLTCLEWYTSVKNLQSDPTKRLRYVDDPMVDGQTHRGRYRQAAIRTISAKDGDLVSILEVLKRGWIQQLVNADHVDWSEAVVDNKRNLPNNSENSNEQDFLVIKWPGVDPTKAEAIADTLNADTYSDVAANQQAIAGTWYRIDTRWDLNKDDGSANIYLYVINAIFTIRAFRNRNTPTGIETISIHNIPVSIVPEIIAAYDIEGYSVYPEFGLAQGTVDLLITTGETPIITILNRKVEDGCLTEVYHDYYFGLTKAEYEALDCEAPAGWIYRIGSPSLRSDGKYNSYREREYAVPRISSEFEVEDNVSFEATNKQYDNQSTAPSIASFVQGILYRIRNAVYNKYCRWNYTKEKVTSKPDELEFDIDRGDGTTDTHIFKWNQDDVDIDDPPDGKEQQLQAFSRNEDGTFNWYILQQDYDGGEGEGNGDYYLWRTSNTDKIAYTDPSEESAVNRPKARISETVYQWKTQVKKFTTSKDAYAWLQQSVFYREPLGVSHRGRKEYLATKTWLEESWENISRINLTSD